MKTKAIILVHSFVDVITNSSTELFIIDKEKGLETVKETVSEALKKYPMEYPSYGTPDVRLDNPTFYNDMYYNEGEAELFIKFLELKGYKVIPPEKEIEPEAIVISWERGSCSQGFINFIEKTFNAEIIDY